ncbi:hypothetical protein [Liquorilactobacillus hordei]|uniref:Uncharacterized protein n=1 Tax=Liquorilactobacillus hordei DSM 19519 TaxID=1423759 RepID=A0A0R1M7H7_9LACO|nr:hypothetical protein [Liquorilactobacillus hordei]KRL03881.1 hypothetical protein FC92_GL001946 [Liquorilactobacillus hordei DSM 19519]QYH51416.1 hypothetical protein G6O70_02475 [Liquorilactobacillus hordei DSM 19519]
MSSDKSDTLELLIEFKKEIYKLGLEKTPSKTLYQEKYTRGAAPSPTTLLNRTGKTWKEILELIGIKDFKRVKVRDTSNMGRPEKVYDVEKNVVRQQLEEFFKVNRNVKTQKEFKELLKQDKNMPSFGKIYNYGYSWGYIKKNILKIGEEDKKTKMLEEVVSFLTKEKYDVESINQSDLGKILKKQNNLPSIATLYHNKVTLKDIKDMMYK